MERKYEKIGRQAMPRSMKKKVKKEKKQEVQDEETLDQQRYLGEIQPPIMQ